MSNKSHTSDRAPHGSAVDTGRRELLRSLLRGAAFTGIAGLGLCGWLKGRGRESGIGAAGGGICRTCPGAGRCAYASDERTSECAAPPRRIRPTPVYRKRKR